MEACQSPVSGWDCDARGKVVPKWELRVPYHGGHVTSHILCRKIVTQPMLSRAALTSRCCHPAWHSCQRCINSRRSHTHLVLEHPLGSIDVALTYSDGNDPEFQKAGVVRTAKKIMAGEIFVAKAIFEATNIQPQHIMTAVARTWLGWR